MTTREQVDEALLRAAGNIAKAVGRGYVEGINNGKVPSMLVGPKIAAVAVTAATGNPFIGGAVGYATRVGINGVHKMVNVTGSSHFDFNQYKPELDHIDSLHAAINHPFSPVYEDYRFGDITRSGINHVQNHVVPEIMSGRMPTGALAGHIVAHGLCGPLGPACGIPVGFATDFVHGKVHDALKHEVGLTHEPYFDWAQYTAPVQREQKELNESFADYFFDINRKSIQTHQLSDRAYSSNIPSLHSAAAAEFKALGNRYIKKGDLQQAENCHRKAHGHIRMKRHLEKENNLEEGYHDPRSGTSLNDFPIIRLAYIPSAHIDNVRYEAGKRGIHVFSHDDLRSTGKQVDTSRTDPIHPGMAPFTHLLSGPHNDVDDFHREVIGPLHEEKAGLWANIWDKRERIKNGSGERMRRPGSKGAPTASDFRAAGS